ncbi:MAG TPA: winged helix-turn-helix domain-containing protein [Candidatus Nanoarchaeia archaeon]|nr:winged helix-turn-helix domain-containing protein [Candidatus Nanoarchaeia archaeon]
MTTYFRRVTIVKVSKPKQVDVNEGLQWLSNSLGLFGTRDKDKSSFRIFIELLKVAKIGKGLSSDQLAERANLTRGTIIHHLNNLIEQGIVICKDNKYYLRVNNLEELIKNLRSDIDEVFNELKEMAEELDKELNLK